jgi:hypothetical protein
MPPMAIAKECGKRFGLRMGGKGNSDVDTGRSPCCSFKPRSPHKTNLLTASGWHEKCVCGWLLQPSTHTKIRNRLMIGAGPRSVHDVVAPLAVSPASDAESRLGRFGDASREPRPAYRDA